MGEERGRGKGRSKKGREMEMRREGFVIHIIFVLQYMFHV